MDDIKDVESEILREQLDREEFRQIEFHLQRIISKKIAKILIPCNDQFCDDQFCECEESTQFVIDSIPFIKHFLICPECDDDCFICES